MMSEARTEEEHRQWARDNFKFFNSKDAEKHIHPSWHPVVREECIRMRDEYMYGLKLRLSGQSQAEVERAVEFLRMSYDKAVTIEKEMFSEY